MEWIAITRALLTREPHYIAAMQLHSPETFSPHLKSSPWGKWGSRHYYVPRTTYTTRDRETPIVNVPRWSYLMNRITADVVRPGPRSILLTAILSPGLYHLRGVVTGAPTRSCENPQVRLKALWKDILVDH